MEAGIIDDGQVVFVDEMGAHTSYVPISWKSVVPVGEVEEADK